MPWKGRTRTSWFPGRATVLIVMLMVGCSGRQSQPATHDHQVAVAVEEPAVEQASVAPQCTGRVWQGDFETNDVAALLLLEGYAGVTGHLSIMSIHDVEELPLDCLREVGGELRIHRNRRLKNLDSLNNLTFVGGSLYIGHNPALANLNGLSSLASLYGSLFITNNDALTNLNGLSNLTSVGGGLGIYDNDGLVAHAGICTGGRPQGRSLP